MGEITKLEILRELDKRGALDSKQQRELYQLELGSTGEERVLKWVQQYGESHWEILQNVWLSYFGTFECDVILFTKHKIYLFEIKNYSKQFKLRNGQCYLGGERVSHNPVSQAQKVFVNFENLMRNSNCFVPIETALIFVGEHCEVSVHDAIQDVTILQLNQVRDYLKKIAEEEKYCTSNLLDIQRVRYILEKNKGENYYLPTPLPCEMEARIRKGILCSRCGSFELDSSKLIITCPQCLTQEPRENIMIRTICEYGVIHFDKDLETSKVVEFFDRSYSDETIRKYMRKHFELQAGFRGKRYINNTLPFKKMLPLLNLETKQLQIYTDY